MKARTRVPAADVRVGGHGGFCGVEGSKGREEVVSA
jgi:hypothetical protein